MIPGHFSHDLCDRRFQRATAAARNAGASLRRGFFACRVPATVPVRDPGRADAMGFAGRKRAVTEFSWDAVAAQTAALYAELAAGTLRADPGASRFLLLSESGLVDVRLVSL